MWSCHPFISTCFDLDWQLYTLLPSAKSTMHTPRELAYDFKLHNSRLLTPFQACPQFVISNLISLGSNLLSLQKHFLRRESSIASCTFKIPFSAAHMTPWPAAHAKPSHWTAEPCTAINMFFHMTASEWSLKVHTNKTICVACRHEQKSLLYTARHQNGSLKTQRQPGERKYIEWADIYT